ERPRRARAARSFPTRRSSDLQLGVVAALDQGGPVDHLQVGLEAGFLELLGHHERHVVVELVLAARHDADRLAAVAGLGRLLLGEDRKSTRLNSSHRTMSYAVL